MSQTLMQRGFATGELAPGLGARADLPKYLSALRTCRNLIVRRHGGVAKRTGTLSIAETKTSVSAKAFLQPFVFAAADASYIIECGDNYFRFFHNGAPVLVSGVAAWSGATTYVAGDLAVSGGINYYAIVAHTNHVPPNPTFWYALPGTILEIPTPYSSGAFQAPDPACFAQVGLLVTITHLNYPPAELLYAGPTRWTLTPIVIGPKQPAPTAIGGVAGAAGTRTYSYVVTSATPESYEESDPCDPIVIPLCAEPTIDLPNSVSFASGAAGADAEFYVYGDGASGNGVYGFLGTGAGDVGTFFDTNFVPDYTRTPPIARPLFGAVFTYPAVSVVYQQRRLFGGTHNNREQVYGSQTGFYSNFEIRSPLQDDDAVTFSLASKFIQPVKHLIGLKQLILLTDGGEWMIRGDQTGTITPTAFNADQHGYVGASDCETVLIGENLLFVQGRGNIVRDLRFDVNVEGLSGRDLTIYSAHLFAGFTVVDACYASVPDSVVWYVRSDGVLLGLTYIKEEDVWGWHRHDTDGTFEQVCTIPEGNEDAVYVIVRRTIQGVQRRFVERFTTRQYATLTDAVFMDAAKTSRGAARTVVTGLTHLKGKTVAVLADGVIPPGTFVVSDAGTITLPKAAVVVSAGLPVTAELETLDLDVAGSAIRDARKMVKSVSILLEASARGFLVGPDASSLLVEAADAWDAPGLVTDQVEINLTSGFNVNGRLLIRQSLPLPLTVLGVLPRVEVGG